MRKYLLLASVAGCLMANNAIASGEISTDGHSVTLDASVDFEVVKNITDFQDINFGKIVLLTQAIKHGDTLATLDIDDNVAGIPNKTVVRGTGQTTGVVCIEGDSDVDTTVTCVGTPIATAGNACLISCGLAVKVTGSSGYSGQNSVCPAGSFAEALRVSLVKSFEDDELLYTQTAAAPAVVVSIDY